VKTIEHHQVVVISGETGCGKTTQVLTAFCELICMHNFLFMYRDALARCRFSDAKHVRGKWF